MANENAKAVSKEKELNKFSKMARLRRLLPVVGLIAIFILFNALTGGRMISNMNLVLSQVYVTMIASMGVFFVMSMGGLDFSQGSILGIASIVVCTLTDCRLQFSGELSQELPLERSTVSSMLTVKLSPLL